MSALLFINRKRWSSALLLYQLVKKLCSRAKRKCTKFLITGRIIAKYCDVCNYWHALESRGKGKQLNAYLTSLERTSYYWHYSLDG